MINHKNYEIWFLDFAEGNLSERQIELLMDFLAKNDDLRAEFDALELIKLPADDSFVFDAKDKLKRPLTANIALSQDDKLLIGELENDLDTQQKAQLEKRLKDRPALGKDQKIYQKTQLVADLSVKYPNKEELKRKERRVIPLRVLMQIAAALLLLFVMIFALRKGENGDPIDLPMVQTPTTPTPDPSTHDAPVIVPQQEMVEENVEVPKPIIEQAIIPLQKTRKMAIHQAQPPNLAEEKEPVLVEPAFKQAIVNEEPKLPKSNVPQIQAPPKPILEPELPESKTVIVSNEAKQKTPKAVFVNQQEESNPKRLIALNKPKDFLRNAVDKGVKKLVKKEDVKERLTVPEAIVSTVGAITKKKVAYTNKTSNKAKRVSVSFGKFKFSRVKHRSR